MHAVCATYMYLYVARIASMRVMDVIKDLHAGICLSVLKPEMPVVYKDIFSKHKLCRYAD